MRLSSAVAAIALATAVNAGDHKVTVGADSILSFNPNQLTGVANGDTVTFEFHPKNHSVTQSTFTNPCQQSVGGVNSGYLATDPTATTFSQWQITIDNASAPLWFFCAQVTPAVHCHSGMVFSVNANAAKTFEQFQLNANQSTLSFTDAGQPPQPTQSAVAPPVGQTDSASAAGQTNPAAGGASQVGNTAGGVAAATTSGSVPTGNVPAPAPSFTGSGGVGAGGAVSNNTPTPGAAPASASRMSAGASGLLGVMVMLVLLL